MIEYLVGISERTGLPDLFSGYDALSCGSANILKLKTFSNMCIILRMNKHWSKSVL